MLSGIAVMVTVQPRLQQLWERWGNDPEWAFLVSRLDFVNGLALMVLLDEGAEDEVIGFLERALADPAFIERLKGEMEEAPRPPIIASSWGLVLSMSLSGSMSSLYHY